MLADCTLSTKLAVGRYAYGTAPVAKGLDYIGFPAWRPDKEDDWRELTGGQ
jgi:hypothetical protein